MAEQCRQLGLQAGKGAAAVAMAAFLCGRHLGKAEAHRRHPEEGIVTKAPLPNGGLQDVPIADPLGGEGNGAVRPGQGQSRDEPGRAVLTAGQFLQQALQPPGIAGGIAGGVDAGTAVQGIHTEAGIIRQGPCTGEAGHGCGLQAGVGKEIGAGFLHRHPRRLRAHINGPMGQSLLQKLMKLRQLAGVAAGNDKHGLGHGASGIPQPILTGQGVSIPSGIAAKHVLAVPGQVGLVSGCDGDGLLPAQFSLGCLAEAG